ncbi:MAG: hypothetical protein L0Y78_09165 [candidate division NC10 bacterium]|nr:hypothetical protein [candidate division NC10 bacterium]
MKKSLGEKMLIHLLPPILLEAPLVEPLSKTICLGVIILALQVLRGLKFPRCLRIIFWAARALGVSRKAGYFSARRIRDLLQGGHIERPDEELRR